jgi:ferric-dicitrate binding protein FerR (iron transport regulator)
MDDRYLWDRTGPPDREIARLEEALRRFRHKGEIPASPQPRSFPARRLLAVAAVLVAACGALWIARWDRAVEWHVERLEGEPVVGSTPVSQGARLPVGIRIETNGASRAKLGIARIAEITIAPNSRMRLVKSRPTEQRLALERGRISANISAPPRIFFVETPSALAVDLGCSYTLEVDEAGTGLLRVETGWVAFEGGERESIVPAGAVCATQPESGPETPYYEDSTPAFRRALAAIDAGSREFGDLSALLSEARRRDGLTLWHLLAGGRTTDPERVRARLTQLVPPPAGVTPEGVRRGDRKMLEAWRGELDGMPELPNEGSLQSLWRKLRFRLTGP